MDSQVPMAGAAAAASGQPGQSPRAAQGASGTMRRRATGGVLLGAIVAGTVGGGVAGSAMTALALQRGARLAAAPGVPAIPQPVLVPAGNSLVPENGLRAIYKSVGPAVVSVRTASAASGRSRGLTPPSPNTPGSQNSPSTPLMPSGEGSGFIVDGDGHVLTNNHVVQGASQITIILQDGTEVSATVAGTDPGSDLAVLKANIPAGKAGVAALGDSDAVQPGDVAIAIGTPFGLDHTITAGIISAVNRDFGTAAGRPMRGLLQTDAPINPGNSGGPLLNAAGEVIGITASIESPVRGSVGIGFAIPINAAKRLLPQLSTGKKVEHAWIGISGTAITSDVAQQAGLPASVTQGVLVSQVVPDGPAARAGLRGGTAQASNPAAIPTGGDVILAIDGRTVKQVQDISAYLETKGPSDAVTVTLLRNGQRQDVRVALAAWPLGRES